MNIKTNATIAAAGLMGVAMALPAHAQTAEQPAAPPAPAAPAAPASSFSDSEVEQFASAAVNIQQIQQEPAGTTEDKQTKMAGAVQQSGLTPQKFNEIAMASRSDSNLMQRIQAAAGKVAGTGQP